ncbi:MAG: tRNA (guanosine(37)-N1)-methyltransferase TrmD [Caldilineae bacterium]|nr:tRNA (guanosine(37)-N1)-methyltransferase TrmD [Caldilineae bacterium]
MRIDILTVLPEMFVGPFDVSILRRARDAGLVDIRVHDLRDWAHDRHRTTDDYAYGGGGGMVMKPEPVFEAVEALLDLPPTHASEPRRAPCPVLMMTPQGRRFDDAMARSLAAESRLVILCGHYEGFDERIREHLATHEVSVGDFVMTGGEIPAMVVTDAVARLRPGVVGLEGATQTDSFATGLLEHPHFTRPADFRGWTVPELLTGGNHGAVDRWRRQEALRRTLERRPDLLETARLDAEQRAWLDTWLAEASGAGDTMP